MMLRLLEHMHHKADHQMIVSEDPDRAPKGWLFPDKLGQAQEGIVKHIALSFIIGACSTIVPSTSMISILSISRIIKLPIVCPS